MRIAFVWYFDKASQVMGKYRDGLRTAIEIIGKEHQVDWYLDKDVPWDDDHDVILFWDDSNSEFFSKLDNYHAKKGIFLTTDPHNFDNLRKLDVVYCESEPVYETVRAQGIHAVRAFGTDTDFFKPKKNSYGDHKRRKIEKDIKYFYPATFSPWKRQSAISNLGHRLLCVGTIQPDGLKEYDACIKSGVRTEIGYFPVKKIREYYLRAENVVIPAIHGSERTVLEAMSCGIKPQVNPENKKAHSYIEELEESGLSPREFVVKNYSAQKYAKDILRGIE